MFDEIQKEAIRIEAKSLLRRFSEKLKDVRIDKDGVEQKGNGMRGNAKLAVSDGDFRDKMFANAKNKEGDFIIAERKKW